MGEPEATDLLTVWLKIQVPATALFDLVVSKVSLLTTSLLSCWVVLVPIYQLTVMLTDSIQATLMKNAPLTPTETKLANGFKVLALLNHTLKRLAVTKLVAVLIQTGTHSELWMATGLAAVPELTTLKY